MKVQRPTMWRGADGYGRLATAWYCLRDHCKADEEWRSWSYLFEWAGWLWWLWCHARWLGWLDWLPRKLWCGTYTAKALVCVLLLPERWPKYSDYPEQVLVTTGHEYTPDHEYSGYGSWHEVYVGHGWRPRTWWWHWAWESSV